MESSGEQKRYLKPMHFAESFLWFGFWAIILILSTYVLMPNLSGTGFSDFEKFSIAMMVPMVLMFFTALITYWLQNNKSMKGLYSRYRMKHFSRGDLLWTIALSFGGFAGFGIFSALGSKLISIGAIPIPENLPFILDPNAVFNHKSLNQLVGGEIIGNWKVIIIYFIMLFFNIAGEELLWRGYILPRQELAFGKKTWLVHGLLWTMFHCFKWWDMISMLPFCLLLSFVAQKRKSIWPGFIAHYLLNIGGFIVFLAAVLGFVK